MQVRWKALVKLTGPGSYYDLMFRYFDAPKVQYFWYCQECWEGDYIFTEKPLKMIQKTTGWKALRELR